MEATLPLNKNKLDSLISEFDTSDQESEYLAFWHRQVAKGKQSGDLSSETSRARVRAALAERQIHA